MGIVKSIESFDESHKSRVVTRSIRPFLGDEWLFLCLNYLEICGGLCMSDYIIRHVEPKDASGILKIRTQESVAENTLGLPYQSLKKSEQFLERVLADPTSYFLVAEQDDQIVGICSIKVFDNPKMNHAATLGIMVHEDFHGQGIGNALMTEILRLSDEWLMLKRIELGVISDNKRAQKLYEKHGFVIEGIKKYAVKKNGKFADEIVMGRYR